MPALGSSDLASASTGSDIYVYYQAYDGHIHESYSADGSSWKDNGEVASDSRSSGTPMTAYFVKKDADHGGKSTIHVLYLDSSSHLAERVKILGSTTWETVDSSGGLKDHPPDQTSRLMGGSFNGQNWNPDGSQWVYYVSSTTSKQPFTEIRRTPTSPWIIETVLDENTLALGGTHLGLSIRSGSIDLFFQNHSGDILKWANRNNKWQEEGTVIKSDKVEISSSFAASSDGSKDHLFYVENKTGPGAKIQHSVDGKVTPLETFYQGTGLSSIIVGGKVYLFYVKVAPVGAVATKVYDGSNWKDGPVVHS